MLMEGTLHSVNGSARTRLCTDALSTTLQHGSVRIHLAPVRRHLTTCNALPYVLEMCMYKLGSSNTPGNALAAAGHYTPLTKGGARGLECNALITLHEKS